MLREVSWVGLCFHSRLPDWTKINARASQDCLSNTTQLSLMLNKHIVRSTRGSWLIKDNHTIPRTKNSLCYTMVESLVSNYWLFDFMCHSLQIDSSEKILVTIPFAVRPYWAWIQIGSWCALSKSFFHKQTCSFWWGQSECTMKVEEQVYTRAKFMPQYSTSDVQRNGWMFHCSKPLFHPMMTYARDLLIRTQGTYAVSFLGYFHKVINSIIITQEVKQVIKISGINWFYATNLILV